jgi:hypothetical protein
VTAIVARVVPATWAVLLAWTATTRAEEATPLNVAAKLLFKIATYDANLPQGEVRLGVVFPATDREVGTEAVRAFQSLESMRVNGRSIGIVPVPFHSADEITGAVVKNRLYGLFLASTTPAALIGPIRQLAKDHHVFTFAQDPSWVEKGLTAGI